MAICLRRSFKSSSSFVFICKRNLQTNFFDQRVTTTVPQFKEMGGSDYYFLSSPYSNDQNSKVVKSLRFSPQNSFQWANQNPVYGSKFAFDYESSKKFHSVILENELAFCAKECEAYKEDIQKETDSTPGRPNPSQVQHVFKVLSEDLPRLFVKPMNYGIYHPNMIFENNIRGTKTVGLFGYVKQIALLKTVGHIKFANVTLDILKITAHPEDGTVRVRWRIRGVPNYKAFFSFLKTRFSIEKEAEGWYDGFSVFYVRSDGLVHKHTVDKMMPDSEEKVSSIRNDLAAKVAFAMGVMLKDFSSLSVFYEEIQKDSDSSLLEDSGLFEIFSPLGKLGLLSALNYEMEFSKVAHRSEK